MTRRGNGINEVMESKPTWARRVRIRGEDSKICTAARLHSIINCSRNRERDGTELGKGVKPTVVSFDRVKEERIVEKKEDWENRETSRVEQTVESRLISKKAES